MSPDEDGVAMIPAPPSEEVDSVNPNSAADSIGGSSSIPSRDSVYAAIALVRAKQDKSGTMRPEEEFLQKRPVSSNQTSPSNTSESSRKENSESENAAQIITASKEPIDLVKKESNVSSIKDVASPSSASQQQQQQPCPSSDSLPQGPSFEQTPEEQTSVAQTPDDPSTAVESSAIESLASTIPAPPSFETENNDTVGGNPLDAVNAFLNRLGVGALHSASIESTNSIDRLRMLSSGGSSDYVESRGGSAALEVQPESVEEIAALIDAVREEHLANEAAREQNDPTGASISGTDENSYPNKEDNPFIDNSFSGDEKKIDDNNEEFRTRYGGESFAADVRTTLSTVKEVESIEVDDDESNTDALNYDYAQSPLKQDQDNVPYSASGEHESVYGDDGKKEPRGVYEKAKVEVDKRESENYDTNDGTSVGGYSDNGSLPWAIRDVASEETLRATGRRRPHFIVSGPRPSKNSRNAVSLFDDISQQPSEAASEMKMGFSFGSEDKGEGINAVKVDDKEGETTEKEVEPNEDNEIETIDSMDDDHHNRCMIDAFLYNKYEPENEYTLKQNDEPISVDGVEKEDSKESSNSEVQPTDQDQGIEVDNLNLPKDAMDLQIEETKIETTLAPEETEIGEDSNPFLRQFEALDLEDEAEDEAEDDGEVESEQIPVVKSPAVSVQDPSEDMSPGVLRKYFENIDRRRFEGEKEEKLSSEFKILMMPVMNGKIPTIIEEARIRQAALKADIPLQFVDTFVDYVKDQKTEVPPQISKEQSSHEEEGDFLSKGWENIADLNEDDAIAAFLSSKIEVEDLNKEDICKIAEEAQKANVERKQKEEELMEAGSRDYEPSVTSESQDEAEINAVDDSEVEEDVNVSGVSEADTDGTDEESEHEPTGVVDTTSGNVHEEPKTPVIVTKQVPIDLPKDVKSGISDEPDIVDKEMLRACRRLQVYDEGIWQRRAAMATFGWEWEERTWLSPPSSPQGNAHFSRPDPHFARSGIHSVTASRDTSNFMFNKRSFPLARKYCKLSYKRRVKPHAGYLDVDMFSLQESAASGEANKYTDGTPWELRNVRQRFLHERSLTFSRNWFGDLVKTSGNDKIKAPICKPKSMEMPMRKIPDPGDWTPEWYTTWGGRKLLMRRPSLDSSVDSHGDSYTEKRYDDNDSLRSYSSADSSYEDDEEWEDAPECGTFVNTKLKIGEHVSRVHPNFTSSLRKSRWRKKYFPIGTFPY